MKLIFALEMTPHHNSVKGRREQIFERLSKDYKVIYFSKMENILSIIKNHPKDILKRLKLIIINQKNNFIRIELPAIFLPAANIFRIINKINNIILSFLVQYIRKKYSIKKVDIWWVGYPYAVDYVKDKSNIVYDCFDEHLGWKGYYLKSTVKKIERDLLQLADISIFSASKLLENKGKYVKRSFLILNGADYDYFYIPPVRSINLNKIVLYSGVISHWFDIELIEYSIVNLKNFTFWFVGPDRGNYLRYLCKFKNVKYFGLVQYDNLSKYYHESSVCIIPFKVDKLIESTNPIKLYEYLSAGKPVVTTKFPEAEKYKSVIYIADDKISFSNLIIKAHQENEFGKIAKRQKIASINSWDHRVHDIKKALSCL